MSLLRVVARVTTNTSTFSYITLTCQNLLQPSFSTMSCKRMLQLWTFDLNYLSKNRLFLVQIGILAAWYFIFIGSLQFRLIYTKNTFETTWFQLFEWITGLIHTWYKKSTALFPYFVFSIFHLNSQIILIFHKRT